MKPAEKGRVVSVRTDGPALHHHTASRARIIAMRLHEMVVLQMKSWLPAETLKGLRQAEKWRREEVRLHFQVLERFREEQRRDRANGTSPCEAQPD
jgi:hypothetical protein